MRGSILIGGVKLLWGACLLLLPLVRLAFFSAPAASNSWLWHITSPVAWFQLAKKCKSFPRFPSETVQLIAISCTSVASKVRGSTTGCIELDPQIRSVYL